MTLKETMMPMVNNYHGTATFGPASPANASRSFQQAASPGPNGTDIYNHSPDHGYVQATSPQPTSLQPVAMNRVSKNRSLLVLCSILSPHLVVHNKLCFIQGRNVMNPPSG